MNTIYQGDCLEVMKVIPDKSIDMILCDLPYGTTACKWDNIIPFEPLWALYKRIIKDNGAVVLTAIQPFTSSLIVSNYEMFKYEWIWVKDNGTGFLNAKKQPLRIHESVLVFYKKQSIYNPQMRPGKPYKAKSGDTKSLNYGEQVTVHTACESGERYPLTVLSFIRDKEKIHPTQKPVALFEYLIKTYTNEGDLVLDNCIGSGTTAIAALRTGRNFIGIEKEQTYVDIANKRIEDEIEKILAEDSQKAGV